MAGGFPINLVSSGGFGITEAPSGWPVEPTEIPAFPCTLMDTGGYPVVFTDLSAQIAAMAAAGLFDVQWDMTDSTSLYLDDNGIGGNVTADGQTIGMIVGKNAAGGKTASAFIAAQPEMATNGAGGFSGTTGWTVTSGSLSEVAGDLKVTYLSTAYVDTRYTFATTAGKMYKAVITARRGSTAADVQFVVKAPTNITDIQTVATSTTNGTVTCFFVAPTTSASLTVFQSLAPSAAGDFYVEEISLVEVPGVHFTISDPTKEPEYDTANGFGDLKFDGTNDSIGASVVSLPANAAIFCTIKTTDTTAILFNDRVGTTGSGFVGCLQDGSTSNSFANSGAPTMYVDRVAIGNSRQDLYDAIADGNYHTLEIRGADLSAWTGFYPSGYASAAFFHGGWYGPALIVMDEADVTDARRSTILSYLEQGVNL